MAGAEHFENGTVIEELPFGAQLIVPEEITDISSSLLTFPAIGDIVREQTRFSPKGNITKDSQEVARQLQRPILLSNRPRVGHVALQSMSPAARRQQYNDSANRHAEQLATIADTHGIQTLDLFAESIGATHGLAVVRADQLPISRFGTYDGVGWFNVSVRRGAPYYGRYTFLGEQSRFIDEHPGSSGAGPEWYEPTRLQHGIGVVQMVGRLARDSAANAAMLSTDISLNNSREIRDRLPHIAGLILFAESSFNTPPEFVDRAAVIADLQLAPGYKRLAAWKVEEEPGMAHDSINNMDIRVAFIRRVLALETTTL